MNFIYSQFYAQLIRFCDYIFVSILWIICCLPVITIIPATISLFTVVRSMRKDESEGIFSLFLSEMKNNFLKKIGLSIGMIIFITVVYLDIEIFFAVKDNTRNIMFVLLCTSILVIMSILVHFFYIYVISEEKKLTVIFKNALMIAISQLHLTMLGLFVVCFAAFIVMLLPFIIFFIGGFMAYLLSQISSKALKNIQTK